MNGKDGSPILTGAAPVYLHDVMSAAVIARGVKPYPRGESLVNVPVRVALYLPGQFEPFSIVEAAAWHLTPRGPDTEAELIVSAELPAVMPGDCVSVVPVKIAPMSAAFAEAVKLAREDLLNGLGSAYAIPEKRAGKITEPKPGGNDAS